MKQFNILGFIAVISLLFPSCKDEIHTARLDFPNDITFDVEDKLDITVPHLHYVIPEAPFKVGAYHKGTVTFNVKKNTDGTHTGFALSSKNYRSYPWCNAKSAVHLDPNPDAATLKAAADSSLFSVYTWIYPNQSGNFAVVRVLDDEAYFTLDKPRTVEHVLVANTNYNYMLCTYGSRYSAATALNPITQVYDEYTPTGALAVVMNPNLPDGATAKYRVWYMPDVYNFGKGEDFVRFAGQQILAKIEAGTQAADLARAQGKTTEQIIADSLAAYDAMVKGYVKLIAKGYLGATQTGTAEHYMTLFPGVDPREPYVNWNTTGQSLWLWWDLSSLGTVDKVVFNMDSSDKDANGNMRTPPYFCMDGIRLSRE